MGSPTVWAQHGTYPPRQGNEVQILIDGQTAYGEIADTFTPRKEIHLSHYFIWRSGFPLGPGKRAKGCSIS